MNFDEVLETVEKVLLSRQLSPIERYILHQSWIGQAYTHMAENSSYCSAYIKTIGSQLWQDLSAVLGEKVTKKNLHVIWNNYQKKQQQLIVSNNSAKSINLDGGKDKTNLVISQPLNRFPDGPVALNSPFYINRPPIEELVYSEINRPGCLIRIKAPQKMGKTSLLNRILARAKACTDQAILIDFQEADADVFASLDKFLRWFCINLSKQLNLHPMLDEFWYEELGSKLSCKIYFEDYILKQIPNHLTLALNEVNRLFEYPALAQDFLQMLRSWHENARVKEIWQKLRLVVVYSTEIYIPLKLNQSPFNIGLSIRLPAFDSEQVMNLAQRYGIIWNDSNEIQKLMAMIGGHPYLINIAFYHLSRGDTTLQQLLKTAPTPAGIYSNYLRYLLVMLQNETELISALQQLLNTSEMVQLEAIAAYKLESMGLVKLEEDRVTLSCELYRLYFQQQLPS